MITTVTHPYAPVFTVASRVLILGTMPSPASRALQFYYAHPRNRFWPVLAAVLGQPVPVSIDEKITLLHTHRIALWDVLASCRIDNADDSTITEPVANDFTPIFETSDIQAVFTTGKKATYLYERYGNSAYKPIYLPSTSPANCACSFASLVEAYGSICRYL